MSFWTDLEDEFVSLLGAVGTFLGICGPSGLKVATDIMAQVSQGGTTPGQVLATAADIKAFTDSVQAAQMALKANQGTSTASVLAAGGGDANR